MKRKILWISGGLVVTMAGVYIYYATLTHPDMLSVPADYKVDAISFIKEFHADQNMANQKYTERNIEVSGTVSVIEKADSAINVKMIDSATGSYLIFAFQDEHLKEAVTIREGQRTSIKGSCSGGVHSSILGTTFIAFKRSVLVK